MKTRNVTKVERLMKDLSLVRLTSPIAQSSLQEIDKILAQLKFNYVCRVKDKDLLSSLYVNLSQSNSIHKKTINITLDHLRKMIDSVVEDNSSKVSRRGRRLLNSLIRDYLEYRGILCSSVLTYDQLVYIKNSIGDISIAITDNVITQIYSLLEDMNIPLDNFRSIDNSSNSILNNRSIDNISLDNRSIDTSVPNSISNNISISNSIPNNISLDNNLNSHLTPHLTLTPKDGNGPGPMRGGGYDHLVRAICKISVQHMANLAIYFLRISKTRVH